MDDEDDDMPRKKRMLRSGDKLSFPMTLQDGFGASIGVGHKPGYCFSADATVRDASADLHEANKRRLEGLWKKRKKKPAPQPVQGRRNRGGVYPPPVGGDGTEDEHEHTLDADQLRAQADQAWRDRTFRMSNAWRNR